MAKVSELAKVQLLEEAVVKNDIVAVQKLYDEHKKFEFTARALGLACRYGSLEVVQILLENGATFLYEPAPAIVKKYQCKVDISNNTSYFLQYEMFIIEQCAVVGRNIKGSIFERYENQGAILLAAAERKKILKYLLKNQKLSSVDVDELSYYAMLFEDEDVVEGLRENNKLTISKYRKKILMGEASRNELTAMGRYYREEFQNTLKKVNAISLVSILSNLVESMENESIKLVKTDLYVPVYGADKDKLITKYCKQGLFRLFLEKTNITDIVKKMDLVKALIVEGNAADLEYVMQEKWITKKQDLSAILTYAQENEASAVVVAVIMAYHNLNETKENKTTLDDSFSLDLEKTVETDLKKVWGTKKLEDGTLIITSYKGTETDVVIPSIIGKKEVSAIDSKAFHLDVPRITQEQIDVRRAIVSVTIPGCIKAIPKELFDFGYREHSSLQEVIIEKGVLTIGRRAFAGCSRLKNISLPEGLTTIEMGVFNGCTSMEKIVIPQSVTELKGAFANCSSLVDVELPKNITELPNDMFRGCGFESYTVPEHITKIGECAFANSDNLIEVCLHKNIIEIGASAFLNCKKLKAIVIPDEVKTGSKIFEGCSELADSEGFIVFRGEVQDYIAPNDSKTVKVPNYIETISMAIRLKMPRIVYHANSNVDMVLPNFANLDVGAEISFGQFPQDESLNMQPLTWKVIAKDDKRALVMTKDSIVALYSSVNRAYTGTWEASPYRSWLNHEFFDVVFSESEKEHILTSELINPDNKKEKMSGGNDTEDKIFLLSMEEVTKYLPEGADRVSEMTTYARTQSITKRDSVSSWITRTPGSWDSVDISNYDGDIDLQGNRVGFRTIRPAMWIKLP